MAGMANQTISEAEAIKNHFREPYKKGGMIFFSGFSGALMEARHAAYRREDGTKMPNLKHGGWLAAIGYFALLEQIGNCFRPKETDIQVHGNENGIKKALKLFSRLSKEEIDALYALRCAFAHDFSLSNVKAEGSKHLHHFRVTEGTVTPLVLFPKEEWDGSYQDIKPETTTTVNLELFGDMVEELISRLMEMSQKDRLTIALKGGADELEKRYSFVIIHF
jgi:hypothetical protein